MTTPTPSTPRAMVQTILASLPDALPTSLSTTGRAPSKGDDIYEAYLFALVLKAARAQGYSISVQNPDGSPATSLHLRRGPGRLTSVGATSRPFTHAVLRTGTRPDLELHTGIRIVGKSLVLHEADVLLIPAADADRCRAALVDPPSRTAHLVIEAKYYTQPVTISTGREFLGLRKDLSAKNMSFVSTVAGASATALLAATSTVEYDTGVLPGAPGEAGFEEYAKRLLRDYRSRR